MPQSIQITETSPLLHDANCIYCHVDLELGEQVAVCDRCHSPHHADCWQANGLRCATFGCDESGTVRQVQTHSATSNAVVQNYVQTPSIRTVRTATVEEDLHNRNQSRSYRFRFRSAEYDTVRWQRFKLSTVLRENENCVNSVSWSPQYWSTRIASASEDGVVRIWDAQNIRTPMGVDSPQRQHTLQSHLGPIGDIEWSSSVGSDVLAIAFRDGTVSIWDLGVSREVRKLVSPQQRAADEFTSNLSWSRDRERIAFGASSGVAQIWNANSGESLQPMQCHDGAINSLSWSPDQRWLLTGSSDKTVKVWNLNSGQMIVFSGHDSAVNCVTWSPNSQRFAFGCDDGTVRICDVVDAQEVEVMHMHSAPVTTVSWSPDRKLLASGSKDKTVQVVDVERKRMIRVRKQQADQVNSVSWSSNGWLAAGSSDSTIHIWTLKDNRL